jgi:hypothetical protein
MCTWHATRALCHTTAVGAVYYQALLKVGAAYTIEAIKEYAKHLRSIYEVQGKSHNSKSSWYIKSNVTGKLT